ncbi:MAG TPA: hypothetical protein VIT45_07495 [Allosphingosinicella sp.]
MKAIFPALAIAGALAVVAAATPASAERIRTYWLLKPVVAETPTNVSVGTPFFEQRLLPVRLVSLTEPLAVGSRTLPEGTFLYLVFNDDGKIGYCTIKDRSAGNKAKTLFIPILDQRPCLVDSDRDGRFDKTFSVYDKHGGPPSARGSINGAQPLKATGGYRQVDIDQFPSNLTVALTLSGKSDPAKARLGIQFSRGVGADWPTMRGVPTGDGFAFELMNAQVRLLALEAGAARVRIQWADGVYLSTNNQNTLFWGPLPDFVPRD